METRYRDLACMTHDETVAYGLDLLKRLESVLEHLSLKPGPVIPHDYLMTRKEAAFFIGKSLRTLDRLVFNGEIIKDNVRGSVRFRKSELLRYLGHDFGDPPKEPQSELERIILKMKGRSSK